MQTFPECFTCLVQQALSSMKAANVDQKTQIQTLQQILPILETANTCQSPSELAEKTNRRIRELVKIDDPYQEVKNRTHLQAMQQLDALRVLAKQGDNHLEQVLKTGAAGNVIDVVHADNYDLWREVETTVHQALQGGGLAPFRRVLKSSTYLLYIADNVGETVFDRVVIESLDIPVIYAVKSGPILNDATLKDAQAAGIDQVAEIIQSGSRGPGTILSQCTTEFRELLEEASIVLAKGQANYETLDSQGDKIFFLLRVKCQIISREIGYPVGSLVFKQGL